MTPESSHRKRQRWYLQGQSTQWTQWILSLYPTRVVKWCHHKVPASDHSFWRWVLSDQSQTQPEKQTGLKSNQRYTDGQNSKSLSSTCSRKSRNKHMTWQWTCYKHFSLLWGEGRGAKGGGGGWREGAERNLQKQQWQRGNAEKILVMDYDFRPSVHPPPSHLGCIKVPSSENKELSKVFSWKPGAVQNVALHAFPTARNSAFLISAFPFHSTSWFCFVFQIVLQNKVVTVNSFFFFFKLVIPCTEFCAGMTFLVD